jgi:hypothetical protein
MARIVKREDIVGKTKVKDADAILVNAFTHMGELGVLVMNLCTVGELRDLMEKEAQEYIEAHPEDRI